jgi:hypothetical protein
VRMGFSRTHASTIPMPAALALALGCPRRFGCLDWKRRVRAFVYSVRLATRRYSGVSGAPPRRNGTVPFACLLLRVGLSTNETRDWEPVRRPRPPRSPTVQCLQLWPTGNRACWIEG